MVKLTLVIRGFIWIFLYISVVRKNELSNFSTSKPLLVLDLANNHNGSVDHGKRIIQELKGINILRNFTVAIKFQYRNLPEFIHPEYRMRKDLKYIDRFTSTKLGWDDYLELKQEVEIAGFLTACTPFDEYSVDKIIEHGFDFLKIASASFSDWPLIEKINEWNGPIIASTAGANLDEIDRVVTYFSNRNKDFAIMHCVAVYPTKDNQLLISRIAALRDRYAHIPIGYSTHENPSNLVAGSLALAAGATILERHIGSESNGTTLNSYSSDQATLIQWVNALSSSIEMLGLKSEALETKNPQEVVALSGLRRYAFAQKDIKENQTFTSGDLNFAIPGIENQLQANDIGKYQILQSTKQIKAGEAITFTNTKIKTSEKLVFDIRDQILNLIKLSGITVPKKSSLEISHHYGIEKFLEFGVAMITIINRDYCKKLLILLPGQTHPGMFHKVKDESFFLLFGDLNLKLNNIEVPIKEGEIVSITPKTIHEFSSTNGAIIEEVSTSHLDNDSFYVDETINQNKNRKTVVQYWL